MIVIKRDASVNVFYPCQQVEENQATFLCVYVGLVANHLSSLKQMKSKHAKAPLAAYAEKHVFENCIFIRLLLYFWSIFAKCYNLSHYFTQFKLSFYSLCLVCKLGGEIKMSMPTIFKK